MRSALLTPLGSGLRSVHSARWILAGLSAALLSGCATSYRVTIDSLARPGANAISYSIRTTKPIEQADTLRYQEAAELVRTALSGRGLYAAPANTTPDVIVELDYGVGLPRVQRKKSYRPPGNWKPGNIEKDSNGFVVPPVPPKWIEVWITKTSYEKYLRLIARESAPSTPGRPPAEIWTIDVITEGESQDIRKYLPILAAASIEYIGRDTHGQKTIRIKDTDADVIFVKKGMR